MDAPYYRRAVNIGNKLAVDSASQQEQQLEFSIRWEADLDKWLERGSVLKPVEELSPGALSCITALAPNVLPDPQTPPPMS